MNEKLSSLRDGVIVEVGAVIEGKRINDGCHIEVNAKIGKGAVLGKVCGICDSEIRLR